MCRNAAIGCVGCKQKLTDKLNDILTPVREKRKYYESNVKLVKEYINTGSERANKIGRDTISKVKEAMGILTG